MSAPRFSTGGARMVQPQDLEMPIVIEASLPRRHPRCATSPLSPKKGRQMDWRSNTLLLQTTRVIGGGVSAIPPPSSVSNTSLSLSFSPQTSTSSGHSPVRTLLGTTNTSNTAAIAAKLQVLQEPASPNARGPCKGAVKSDWRQHVATMLQ